MLLEVHEAAMKAGLANCRSALLAGIRADFVASLPSAPTPAAQLLSDLHALADAETLVDDSVPLEIWLLNARILAGSRQEAITFEHSGWWGRESTSCVLAVATRLQINVPSWSRQSYDRRDRLASYFDSIARCLEELAAPVDTHVTVFAKCSELRVYAERFGDAVGDALPATEVETLERTLVRAMFARSFAYELEHNESRRTRALERLAEASGLFRGLSATLRV